MNQIIKMDRRLAALTAAFVVSATAASFAETITFQQGVSPDASYDMGGTDIRSNDDPRQKYGGSANMLVGSFGRNEEIQVEPGFVRGVLEIDLSALKKAASGKSLTVNSASLTLHIASVMGVNTANTIEIGLFTLAEDFDENFDNVETYVDHSVGVTELGTVMIDDTNPLVIFDSNPAFIAAVNAALAGSDTTLRLVLRASAEQEASEVSRFVRFFSDDASPENTLQGAGELTMRPALTIDYKVAP
jgi:hypothetical protein